MQSREQSVDYIFEIVLNFSMPFSTTWAYSVLQGIEQQINFIDVRKFLVLALLGQA